MLRVRIKHALTEVALALLLTLALAAACVQGTFAAERGKAVAETITPREAILLTAFGTSFEKARASYADVEQLVRKAFPDKVGQLAPEGVDFQRVSRR